MKNNKKALTYSLAVLGILALAGTGVAFAADQSAVDVADTCDCRGRFEEMNRGRGQREDFGKPQNLEIKAELLDMDVEILEAELESGKMFHEILEEQGIDRETFRDEMHSLRQVYAQERLAQDVADGKITQEQADEMLEKMANGQGPRTGLRGMRSASGFGKAIRVE